MIKHNDQFLHHNFVVALLNDLFGIQARGGCSCAGPYGHRLLGIDLSTSQEFEREIVRGCEGIKPGWVRVNFNYFISEEVFAFILQAVDLVAEHGWKLIPDYVFDPACGSWKHRRGRPDPPLSLDSVTYRTGKMEYRARHITEPEWAMDDYIAEARRIFDIAQTKVEGMTLAPPRLSPDFEHLRWFPLPHEVVDELQGHACAKHDRVFVPPMPKGQ
jgi:hypothetical protein